LNRNDLALFVGSLQGNTRQKGIIKILSDLQAFEFLDDRLFRFVKFSAPDSFRKLPVFGEKKLFKSLDLLLANSPFILAELRIESQDVTAALIDA